MTGKSRVGTPALHPWAFPLLPNLGSIVAATAALAGIGSADYADYTDLPGREKPVAAYWKAVVLILNSFPASMPLP
jgi:hypothetical protein